MGQGLHGGATTTAVIPCATRRVSGEPECALDGSEITLLLLQPGLPVVLAEVSHDDGDASGCRWVGARSGRGSEPVRCPVWPG